MKCDHCQNEATVQETIIQGGKVVQRNLCETCAKAAGVKIQTPASLPQAIANAVKAHALADPAAQERLRAAAAAAICPSCALTYASFRQTGMLGCPECYKAFDQQLWPLLERAHEGGTHHVGKIPRRASSAAASGEQPGPSRAVALFGSAKERAQRIVILRQQLAEAVAAEQYERAAQLRDELRKLGEHRPAGAPVQPAPEGDAP